MCLITFSYRSSTEAQPIILQVEDNLKKSKNFFKKYTSQTRQLDRVGQDQYRAIETRLTRELTAQENSFTALKKQRPELFGTMDPRERAEFLEQRTRLLQGREIQQSTSDSLRRTQRTIHDTITVGEDTSILLEQQTEKMVGMRDNLHETDNMLDKSRAVLRRMNNRVVTNKLVTTLIILIEIAIVMLIIYVKYYT